MEGPSKEWARTKMFKMWKRSREKGMYRTEKNFIKQKGGKGEYVVANCDALAIALYTISFE